MISASHFLLYRRDPEADRAFFRDVRGLRPIEAGEGWLIFAMSPAEAGIHPSGGEFSPQHAVHQPMGAGLYSMGDDLDAQIEFLRGRSVHCTGMQPAPRGRAPTIPLPSGGRIGLYQPSRTTALNRNSH
jgi:catechol 2,3-dioxygenase-like lactoylglutathione lyase family enzyme